MNCSYLEKSGWPPGDVRGGFAVKIVPTVAVVEAVIIGACVGRWWGIIAGFDMGLFYGLLAAYWPVRWCRTWRNETRARQWAIFLWFIAAIANGISAVVVAWPGLSGAWWWLILGLYGIPYAFFMGPATVDWLQMRKRWTSHSSDRTQVVDLCDPEEYCESFEARTLWSMIVLLALKDRADEIRLEPQKRGMLLRIRVDGQLIELAAPPAHVGPQILREIAGMAGLQVPDLFGRARVWFSLRRLPSTQTGVIAFQLNNLRFEGELTLTASRWWGVNVSLRLSGVEWACDQAVDALREHCQFWRTPRVAPNTGIKHISDRTTKCRLATIAMSAGVDRDQVAAQRRRFRIVKDVTYHEVTTLMKRLTGVRWRSAWVGYLPGRLDRVEFPNRPVIVWIFQPGSWRVAHCIVVKGAFVHDPYYPSAVPLSEYMWGNWRVGFVYQPDFAEA